MNKHFLTASKMVLEQFQQPLTVKDIYELAIENKFLKTEGKTPVNTLRARLSEHIKKQGSNSMFIRVSSNKFALREWNYEEYQAKPFVKKHDETVVCLTQGSLDKAGRFFGFKKGWKKYHKILADKSNIEILRRDVASSNYEIKQLVSYVILRHKNGKYLTYTRGNYANKNTLLKDVTSLGFGGHVNFEDYNNLFGLDDAGVRNSAIREVKEEVKTLEVDDLRIVGIINDDSSLLGLNHIAFVFTGKLPDDFNTGDYQKELSINKLQLLTKKELWAKFSELEFWSQLIMNHYLNGAREDDKVILKSKINSEISDPLVIVGEIGSGKTEVSKFISSEYNISFISTRLAIAELIGESDFDENNRENFQKKALKFINTDDGPLFLSNKIQEMVNQSTDDVVIIDGVRNISTLNKLKEIYPKLHVVYIDTTREKAFNQYLARSNDDVNIDDFRNARAHEVEKEVFLMKSRADVYIYNDSSLENLYNKIREWGNGKFKA